ncbi:MAG: hypothetical protein RR315_08625, partial [Oscillospiraceae bacterium]
ATVKEGFLGALNLILGECLENENAYRGLHGMELLEAPPNALLNAEIPYNLKLCSVVIPYGVAGVMLTEDEPSQAVAYKNKYEYEKSRATPARLESVTDVYA